MTKEELQELASKVLNKFAIGSGDCEIEHEWVVEALEQVQAACRNERVVWPSLESMQKELDKWAPKSGAFWGYDFLDWLKKNIKFEPAQLQQIEWPSEDEIKKTSTYRINNPEIAPRMAEVLKSIKRAEWIDCVNWLRNNIKLAPVDEAKDADIFNMAEREYADYAPYDVKFDREDIISAFHDGFRAAEKKARGE